MYATTYEERLAELEEEEMYSHHSFIDDLDEDEDEDSNAEEYDPIDIRAYELMDEVARYRR